MVQNWIDELWSQNNDLNIINDIHVKIIGKPMNNVIARWSVAPMVEAASPITSTFAEPFNLTMISSSTNYQLQLAKIIQYHPVSSSVFQLPIICVYIYIYTYIIYIYIYTLAIDNWYTNCQSSTPATMKQPATAGCIELVEGGRSSSRCLSRK